MASCARDTHTHTHTHTHTTHTHTHTHAPHSTHTTLTLHAHTHNTPGVPHGDLKAANVLYVDGIFCLTDMPALNWSATPVLTKDPVAHTLVQVP